MPQYNPRTGITMYQDAPAVDELLGGEPVPSASADTAPAADAPVEDVGMLAPAAPTPTTWQEWWATPADPDWVAWRDEQAGLLEDAYAPKWYAHPNPRYGQYRPQYSRADLYDKQQAAIAAGVHPALAVIGIGSDPQMRSIFAGSPSLNAFQAHADEWTRQQTKEGFLDKISPLMRMITMGLIGWGLGGAGAGMATSAGATAGGAAAGAAGGATAGAGMAAMQGNNILEGAVLGGLTGGAAGYAGGATGLEGFDALPVAARQAAIQIGAQALATGGDMETAIASYLLQQGVNATSDMVASVANDVIRNGAVEEVGLSAQGQFADTGEDGMLNLRRRPSLSGPASVLGPDGVARSAQPGALEGTWVAPAPNASYIGDPLNAFMPSFVGMLSSPEVDAAPQVTEAELAQQDAANAQELEAGDTPPAPEPEPTVTGKDVQKYAKLAKSVYNMLNPDAPQSGEAPPPPADAPQRGEDTTDEQYAEQLAQYANLDPATMAEQGFVPGTPEYYEHIMGQMDSIINQVIDSADDPEALAAQLRAKTGEELLALERALFVRGQIGQLMGSGTYVDPLTGLDEEVIAPDGEMVNPGRAAYQRGLARSADKLGRLRGGSARDFIGGMLDRDVDFYGMQERADERSELEEQYMLEDERKRRRGMFGMF